MADDAKQKTPDEEDACPGCEGTGRVPRFLPSGVIDPGPDSSLGSAKEKTCPICDGSGKAP